MDEAITIEIDEGSGFCFGVVTAIDKAEAALANNAELYCLGDIVHNSDEVKRLAEKGMTTITHDDLERLHNVRVLLRAHGEPPSTYATAARNGISIIDATCPVVLRLQRRIKESYREGAAIGRQIVIYGKPGHAEVNGLVGQTDGNAIVVQGVDDLGLIDYSRDVDLYSQTTMSLSGFKNIISEIERRMQSGATFRSFDTICRQVANRVDSLRRFAADHDLVLFVSGKKSSNGKFLFSECHAVNPSTRLISDETDIDPAWLTGIRRIGICGATSTPRWLMERVKEHIGDILGDDVVIN
ncbi:MAG: 4-hydroxy-3-methylbut-2-enyl diphosphate reductase [Bacteroidales bacterium]|nr:4-hydroxy-3-methylbut-2-enyl diphosphate reductase [Bacteroidales bacterium]